MAIFVIPTRAASLSRKSSGSVSPVVIEEAKTFGLSPSQLISPALSPSTFIQATKALHVRADSAHSQYRKQQEVEKLPDYDEEAMDVSECGGLSNMAEEEPSPLLLTITGEYEPAPFSLSDKQGAYPEDDLHFLKDGPKRYSHFIQELVADSIPDELSSRPVHPTPPPRSYMTPAAEQYYDAPSPWNGPTPQYYPAPQESISAADGSSFYEMASRFMSRAKTSKPSKPTPARQKSRFSSMFALMNEAADKKRQQDQFDVAYGLHRMVVEEVAACMAVNGFVGMTKKEREYNFVKRRSFEL